MNKSLFLIPLLLAATWFAGTQILRMKPPATAGETHEHEEGHEHEKEGHVEFSAEALKNAALKIESAAPALIQTVLPLYGRIVTNEESLMHVQPRFPGLVKEVRKRLGDTVAKGEVLAVVESNESLRSYEVKSEVNGTIITKDATLGEFVKDEATLFTIADLSTVWVDLTVYRQDFRKLKQGQPVRIRLDEAGPMIDSTVAYLSPFGAEDTQSMLARCLVPNPQGELKPGLFVTAEVITGQFQASVTVKLAALQTLKEKPVVFIEEGDGFEAREVKLGPRDGEHVQVLSGLEQGNKYVADNSFILKAELGKEEAEHEH